MSVHNITIPTQNGQWVVADLYKPGVATSNDPAPAVIIIPGFQRSKETLSNIAIELSLRDYLYGLRLIKDLLEDVYCQWYEKLI